MSNAVVGNVYQQIIEKVIAASQNDFEEFGVDQSTLDEMKQGWQEKLSALKVAGFPWDPQPEPPPRQPPTVPSNVKPDHELPPPVSGAQDPHVNFPNVPIKSERGYEPPLSAYPQGANGNFSGGYNDNLAQQRAHALVAQRMHGQQQMPHPQHQMSIQPQQQQPQQQQQHQQQHQQQQHQQRMMAAQQQQQQQHQQHPQQHPQHPQQHQQHPQHQQQQQQRPPQPMQQPMQQRMQQRPPPGSIYQAQTDGTGDALEDWKALVAARAAESSEGRIEADQFMRARVDALAARQDSGLMMPLSQMPKGKRRKAAQRVLQAEDAERASSSAPASGSAPGPARFDGDDDEKEHDSDAINSELDDTDEDDNNGDDSDDETMDYMLCTYDKVQRVKNKWKCTLKDGILTTNKKEFLFHKANGEFEW